MLPVDGAQISLWGLKKSRQIILHGDGGGPVGQSYRIVSDIGRGAQHQLRSRAYHTSCRRPRQRAYKSPSVRPQENFPSLFIIFLQSINFLTNLPSSSFLYTLFLRLHILRITMASRGLPRALRLARVAAPRTVISAALPRPALAKAATRVAASTAPVRGIKTMTFADSKETVYERADWPREKLQEYFKNDTLALIGYGSQGHGQGLNLRDQGLNVIVGVRKDGASWKEAIQDGWVPGKNLFDLTEAVQKGTIVMNLLSDAAQSETWPTLKPLITKGKTLYFSHGFSPVFKELTKVDVPKDVDVILVAPKGSGRTVRTLFREGRGINSSIAVYQDVTGKAKEKAIAMGVAVGSGYLYETTFEKEVYSDLYGERGCLMGGIHGMFLAQYEVLRERGHSPSEAFNETVEEATQSLYPLIGANGMDWMYAACSTTARRGAIDWSSRFKDTLKPVFNDLYDSVRDGTETKRSLEYNSQKDYREKYEKEMQDIRDLEIWRAGKAVRSLRPENQK
ncbi:hypothetical protein CNMCM8980_007348 [Aspergillus fumigatiaffinis]|nr:hypothetical protein CNMCM5878_006843 [Aspergillus fumigatiaffinis]KAF4231394.1 hypothetical protein CNMCM6457_005498 [Aspergillus fumigatiaffinis]KAF4247437.1 hypothetical protein CNMCM8980_007348 [Aspergillus fumigatiaffinis]